MERSFAERSKILARCRSEK